MAETVPASYQQPFPSTGEPNESENRSEEDANAFLRVGVFCYKEKWESVSHLSSCNNFLNCLFQIYGIFYIHLLITFLKTLLSEFGVQ